MEPSANVVELLRAAAAESPERVALIEGAGTSTRRITFAGLWRRVCACSAGLRERGLGPDERAVVMLPMSIDLYAALLGVIHAGACAVFVDPWVSPRRIAAFCRYAEPRAFIGVTRSHLLRLLEPRLLRIPLTVTSGRRLGGWPARWTLAELEAAPADEPGHFRRAEDPALITFTTGSSGEPKGANRTHGFLRAQHQALFQAFGPPPGAADLPLFPVFALNNLACRATSVIPELDFRHLERLDAGRILTQCREHGVASCTASPDFLDRLAAHLLAGHGPTPALRRVLTGGAPVRDEQLDEWQRAFPDAELQVVYGSTEAEPVAHASRAERQAAGSERGGICAGRPVPEIRARILRLAPPSDSERPGLADEMPPGEIGELVVSGAHVCRDYFRNPAATAENKLLDAEGRVWHRMGDTGWLDEAGRFWLAGRVHTTIFRAGQACHANLVEEQARRRLGPGQYAALGRQDERQGERLLLVVHTERPPQSSAAALADLQAAGLPVDELILHPRPLPLDPRHNSKVDHPALRQALGLPAR
ncbi:MAG: AMP-binding protein [Candidatus Delongbacteria bacterium]